MTTNRNTFFLPQEEFDRLKGQYAKFNEPWQSDEIGELKSMAEDNIPIKDMSEQLQRTPNGIRMKLKALGLYTPRAVPRPWKEAEDRSLVSMYNDNVPFEEIAKSLGRSEKAIVSRLVNLRVKIFNSQQL